MSEENGLCGDWRESGKVKIEMFEREKGTRETEDRGIQADTQT